MAETTLDYLKRHLDSELQSPTLLQLPDDFYQRLSNYSQKLRRSSGSANSDLTNRLIAKQAGMIESMTRQLVTLRARKAESEKAPVKLLLEERYVFAARSKFQRLTETFVEAVASGLPSFIDFARRTESARGVTVRFVKHVNEMIGFDMKRYGPYEPEDVAAIPAANADILIAGGDALMVYPRDEA